MNFFSNFSKRKQASHKATAWQGKAFFFAFLGILIYSGLLFVPHIINAQAGSPVGTGGEADRFVEQQNAKAAADATAAAEAASCKNKWCCWKFSGNGVESGSNTGLIIGGSILGPVGAYIGNAITGSSTIVKVNGCLDSLSADTVTSDSYGITKPLQSTGIAISEVFLWGGYTIATYSSYLLDYTIEKIISFSITTDKNWAKAWGQTRNLANMLIVLGFVIVGIATALRIKTYAAGQLLWKLILIALVVNFSGLFCGLIIDASNITMKVFTDKDSALAQDNKKQGPPFGQFVVFNTQASSSSLLNDKLVTAGTGKFFGFAMLYTVVYLAQAFTFLYMSAILIARYAILIILFILSPLAFAFWVFPASQGFWSEWWKNFLKWAFVGVFGTFVLWLTTFLLPTVPTDSDAFIKQPSITIIMTFAVVLIFLFVGFKMTAKQTGIASMASKAIMGLAGGAVSLAMGVAGKGAKGLYNSRAGQAARTGLTRAGEKLGAIPPGTANLMEQKQLQEHDSEKRAATWSAEQRKEIATGRTPMTKRGKNDKVEAAKQMATKGELGSLSQDERDSVMAYATSHGVPASVLAKGDYRAAEYDKGRIEKVSKTRGVPEADAKKIVRREQLAQNLPSMTDEQRRNIDHADIDGPANYDFVKQNFNSHMISQLQTAPDPLLRSGMRGHIGQLKKDMDKQVEDIIDPKTKAVTGHRILDQKEYNKSKELHDAINKYC